MWVCVAGVGAGNVMWSPLTQYQCYRSVIKCASMLQKKGIKQRGFSAQYDKTIEDRGAAP